MSINESHAMSINPPFEGDLNNRRAVAKRLIDTAKPNVVDAVLILLTEVHRERLIRDIYQSEAQE